MALYVAACVKSIECGCKIVQAIYLGKLITALNDSASGVEAGAKRSGYAYATVLVAMGLILVFSHHHYYFASWRLGMQARPSWVLVGA